MTGLLANEGQRGTERGTAFWNEGHPPMTLVLSLVTGDTLGTGSGTSSQANQAADEGAFLGRRLLDISTAGDTP